MARRLPTKLKISHAENFFCARNPPCDALDELDLHGVMDRTLTFKENLEDLKTEYPLYNWAEKVDVGPRSYEKEIVADARARARRRDPVPERQGPDAREPIPPFFLML